MHVVGTYVLSWDLNRNLHIIVQQVIIRMNNTTAFVVRRFAKNVCPIFDIEYS